MTKNYQNGKIYRIVSGSGKQYVWSTTETLSQRMARHRGYVKNPTQQGVSSVQLLKEDPQCRIILIENFPCSTSEELRAREQYYIDLLDCVNKKRAFSTDDDKKEQWKKRYEENKDEIKEYKKQYFQDHYDINYSAILTKMFEEPDEKEERLRLQREKKRQADQQYREEKKEELATKTKERYETDETFREQVKQRAKEHQSTEEYKAKRRQKYQENKETINEERRRRYKEDEEFRQKCIEQSAQHVEENRDDINKKRRQRYNEDEEYRNRILEQQKNKTDEQKKKAVERAAKWNRENRERRNERDRLKRMSDLSS